MECEGISDINHIWNRRNNLTEYGRKDCGNWKSEEELRLF